MGNGTGKPFGILNDKEGEEVGITAAAANAITTKELIDLYIACVLRTARGRSGL